MTGEKDILSQIDFQVWGPLTQVPLLCLLCSLLPVSSLTTHNIERRFPPQPGFEAWGPVHQSPEPALHMCTTVSSLATEDIERKLSSRTRHKPLCKLPDSVHQSYLAPEERPFKTWLISHVMNGVLTTWDCKPEVSVTCSQLILKFTSGATRGENSTLGTRVSCW